MKLIGSTKINITKDKDGENVSHFRNYWSRISP